MIHLTICIPGAFKAEADTIASALRSTEVDVRVYEQDVTYRPDSDFWLVVADDLDRQLAAAKTDSRIDTSRFVVLRAPAGTSTDVAERVRPAAVVYAPDASAWQRTSRGGLVVRSDIGEQLAGELGRASQSEHYASWWPGPDHTLAQQLIAYLTAMSGARPRDLTLVTTDEARAHGLPAVTIAADVRGGGMFATPFPGPGVLVTISGPPGGVATIAVVAAKPEDAAASLADVVRMRVGPWLQEDKLQIGSVDTVSIAGAERPAAVVIAGQGFSRAAWLCSVVATAGGTVVVVAGVSARSERAVTATDILTSPAIGKTLATLQIR